MTPAEELVLWEAALTDVLSVGQSLAIAGRSLTRADLKEINSRLKELRAQVGNRSRGPIRLGNGSVLS